MYGMLLESVQHFMQRLHGDETWDRIVRYAGVGHVFTTHGRYPDVIMIKLASACAAVVKDRTREEYMCFFGQCFVEYCSHYGLDKIMRISGRHYRDFLRGIDNLHETMRFSYPNMVNPSFYVGHEDAQGCLLNYRSKRVGFTQYVIGQLTQFATNFYKVHVDIDVVYEEVKRDGCHVVFRLNFDNNAFRRRRPSQITKVVKTFPAVPQMTFFKIFPFALVFNSQLVVTHTGPSLRLLFPRDLAGTPVSDTFVLRRPLMDFTYENVMCHQSVMFELRTAGDKLGSPSTPTNHLWETSADTSEETRFVILKGQMRHIPALDGIAFLCTPLMGNLDDLERLGLTINDLSMYDLSRDMVLYGWQHSSALEYTIEEQVKKSDQIGENLQQLDEWKRRSEQLLYAMIPRSTAERLKNGEDAINTCQMFDSVTIMFCYLAGFTDACNELPAMRCIETINTIFSMFDSVVDEFGIFKVETVGDAVYMAAGGVPDPTDDHAPRVASVALALREKVRQMAQSAFHSANHFSVKTGIHTGGVVAGVIGKRTPQYCLFGDAVNVASRMQTYSEPGKVHISDPCRRNLEGHGFLTVLRGTTNIKGKGEMQTFWLLGRETDDAVNMAHPDTAAAEEPTVDREVQGIGHQENEATVETTATSETKPRREERGDENSLPDGVSSVARSNVYVTPNSFIDSTVGKTIICIDQSEGEKHHHTTSSNKSPLGGSTEEVSGVDHVSTRRAGPSSTSREEVELVKNSERARSHSFECNIGNSTSMSTRRRASISTPTLLDEIRSSLEGTSSRLSHYRKQLWHAQTVRADMAVSRSLPSHGPKGSLVCSRRDFSFLCEHAATGCRKNDGGCQPEVRPLSTTTSSITASCAKSENGPVGD